MIILYCPAFDCEQPPPPNKGMAAFGTWTFGQYARIACINPTEYDFTSLPPPFYKCGQEGFWDPPNSTPFRFPGCGGEKNIFVCYILLMRFHLKNNWKFVIGISVSTVHH